MGLADRDYFRTPPSRSGGAWTGGAVRGWSVTHWIIGLCVAVFVLDNYFLPKRLAPTGEFAVHNDVLLEEYDRIPQNERRYELVNLPDGRVAQVFNYMGQGTPIPVYSELFYRVGFIQKYLQFTTAQGLMYPSKTRGLEGFEFWRFFGYQFLHANFSHIFFNMLGLYMFGPAVEAFLGRKRFLAFYLMCGLFGALLFMLLNAGGIALMHSGSSWIAPFLPVSEFTPLVGASASIYGVIMAGAYLAPNDTVLLFYVIPMRLKTLAFCLIVIAVATLIMQGRNAGGEAAHLGGAAAGFWFIRKPHQLHGFFDFLGRADPTSKSGRVRRAGKRSHVDRAEIDRILDKIKDHGMHSLSEREKQLLRDASRSP